MLRMSPRLTGFIEPCLPSPAPNPSAGDGWIHEIRLDGFRMLARRDGAGVRVLSRCRHNLLLTSVAALLMATSTPHARPELSKTQSWKLILGAWCVGDQPSDNEAYFGIRRDKCGEDEQTLEPISKLLGGVDRL
jgi:hypothetical protein